MKNPDINQYQELRGLLNQDLCFIKERASSLFDQISGASPESIVLYGAGFLGQQALSGLRQIGIQPHCFVDDNPDIWGKEIRGLAVLSPEQASLLFGDKATFVVTIWHPKHKYTDTRKKLIALGCRHVAPYISLVWKYPEVLSRFSMFDSPQKILSETPDILAAFSLLSDEHSKSNFVSTLGWRLSADFEAQPALPDQEEYFPSDIFRLTMDDVIVDCGAYVGDTIIKYIKEHNGLYKRILAFEPDPNNYSELLKRIQLLGDSHTQRIKPLNAAVGAKKQKMNFSAAGKMSSHISKTGSIEVDCLTIDEDCSALNPGYIKMDIEGEEINALKGASQTIKKNKPILAISAYHNQCHLWQIPLIINSFADGYSFFYLLHGYDFVDSVVYAVPANRLNQLMTTS